MDPQEPQESQVLLDPPALKGPPELLGFLDPQALKEPQE